FPSYRPHPHLHSFPTRRSSDLPRVCDVERRRQFAQFSIAFGHRSHAFGLQSRQALQILFKAVRELGVVIALLLQLGGTRLSLPRSEEHTSELQSRGHLVCRLLL